MNMLQKRSVLMEARRYYGAATAAGAPYVELDQIADQDPAAPLIIFMRIPLETALDMGNPQLYTVTIEAGDTRERTRT